MKDDIARVPFPGSQVDEFIKYFFCMEDGREYIYPGSYLCNPRKRDEKGRFQAEE